MLISKDEISSLFAFVIDKQQTEKYAALNAENKVESLEIKKQIDDVAKCLEAPPGAYLSIDGIYAPRNIRRHWVIFDKNFDGNINDGYKFSYGILIDEFRSFLEHINDICTSQFKQWCSSSKILDAKGLDEKLSRLSRAREKLKKELELQNLSPQKDAEVIKTLRIQLEKMDAEYLAALEAKKKMSFDNVAEQNISDKVSKAFDSLKDYTNVIEDERFRLKIEYYVFLWCIPILFLAFVGLYAFFIYDLTSNRETFSRWINFIPYTASIPFFVVLIWLSVYLKCRASKISIEISTRLFNIHYLEGLMKMTNSLSITPEESVRKIDHATELLMNNYLSHIKENYISENDISKLEMSELKSNPYWKVLQELKDLIKMIKK